MTVRILMIVCAVLYYASFALSLKFVRSRFDKPILRNIVFYTACAVNAAAVAFNYIGNIEERGASFIPFVSVYQVLVFLALCFLPIRLFIEKFCRVRGYEAYFFAAAAIVATGPCFMKEASTNYPPALQSVFFIPHIFFYMLSYALAAVAFLVALRAMIKKENHDEMMICCARLLFPFMTAGLFCGAVWADQVWGEFWAWDVKECWSLVTWLNYLVCLHLFKREKMKKYARVLLLTGLLLVVTTFFFSNVLKVASMHSYNT